MVLVQSSSNVLSNIKTYAEATLLLNDFPRSSLPQRDRYPMTPFCAPNDLVVLHVSQSALGILSLLSSGPKLWIDPAATGCCVRLNGNESISWPVVFQQ